MAWAPETRSAHSLGGGGRYLGHQVLIGSRPGPTYRCRCGPRGVGDLGAVFVDLLVNAGAFVLGIGIAAAGQGVITGASKKRKGYEKYPSGKG